MCGIFCNFCIYHNNDNLLSKGNLCEYYVKRRGPNYYSQKEIELLSHKFIFSASVLWLQGANLTQQPIVNDKSVFIYNGDIFGGDISQEDCKVYGDTNLLLKKLEKSDCVIKTLSNIHGPYAFVYLDRENMKLYFGRDIIGRRCLLIGKLDHGFILTSVAHKDIDCMELPAVGIFSYDLKTRVFTLMPWNFKNNNFDIKVKELKEFLQNNLVIEEKLQTKLCKEFREPNKEDLDIFEQINSSNPNEVFDILLKNKTFHDNVVILNNLIENAISKRISTQPRFCKICFPNKNICDHALIGILFSGGLDCTILALLSDKVIDEGRPIDLINVAFEKGGHYDTPDRKTGLDSFNELKKLRPNRSWNFIDVNVTVEELNKERSKHIKHLIHPLNTILDDSLGCALWFASRGRNEHYETPSRVLLVGMGADELFGGYTRHRAALKRSSWLGLHDSLNEDWQNISHRNLARDDRVVSDHGRQLRTPYLDENVVEFVRNLNCWEK